MKGIWIGETDELGCINGKEYEIVSYSKRFDGYGVMDEVGGPYLYDKDGFKITEEFPAPQIVD